MGLAQEGGLLGRLLSHFSFIQTDPLPSPKPASPREVCELSAMLAQPGSCVLLLGLQNLLASASCTRVWMSIQGRDLVPTCSKA